MTSTETNLAPGTAVDPQCIPTVDHIFQNMCPSNQPKYYCNNAIYAEMAAPCAELQSSACYGGNCDALFDELVNIGPAWAGAITSTLASMSTAQKDAQIKYDLCQRAACSFVDSEVSYAGAIGTVAWWKANVVNNAINRVIYGFALLISLYLGVSILWGLLRKAISATPRRTGLVLTMLAMSVILILSMYIAAWRDSTTTQTECSNTDSTTCSTDLPSCTNYMARYNRRMFLIAGFIIGIMGLAAIPGLNRLVRWGSNFLYAMVAAINAFMIWYLPHFYVLCMLFQRFIVSDTGHGRVGAGGWNRWDIFKLIAIILLAFITFIVSATSKYWMFLMIIVTLIGYALYVIWDSAGSIRASTGKWSLLFAPLVQLMTNIMLRNTPFDPADIGVSDANIFHYAVPRGRAAAVRGRGSAPIT